MTRSTVAKKATRSKRTKKASPSAIRTYRQANSYLNSLVNYERYSAEQFKASKLNLARTQRLLSALGNPHRQFRSVHIAGTKGKGSTATMLAEMVRGCGHKVGLYTSPHVVDVRERIQVDGTKISQQAFARAVAAVAAIATKARVPKPTYFEVMTVAAFHLFAQEEVDLAVVETGLGGRLDCTNVLTPEVVGITSISHDHMSQLGDTLAEIAGEKAGIFKQGVPVVSAPQRDSVRETLEVAARELDVPLRISNENVGFSSRFEFSRTAGRHTRICYTTDTSRFEHLQVPLLGDHQAVNCGLALNILDTLKTRGFEIDDQAAMVGLSNVDLPGRMEMIREEPRILIDGAHNAASIDALMRAIGQNITYDSMVVIFACQKHKDVSGMIRRIQLGADKMVFSTTGSPQAADPSELAAEYTEVSGKIAQVAGNLEDAISIAFRAVSQGDLICICGSFYLIGEAKRMFAKANGNGKSRA